MKDDFFNDISKVNLDDYDEDGVNVKEEQKKQKIAESVNNDEEEKIRRRLKYVGHLIDAGKFAEAQEALDGIEKDEISRVGYCEIPQLYYYKMLLDYGARTDDELIEILVKNKEDIGQNGNYRFAKSCADDSGDKTMEAKLRDIKERVTRVSVKPAEPEASKPANITDGDAIKKKLKRIARLVDAGDFEEAEERLKKIEEDEVDRTGDCEIPQVYYYKMLLDYGARTDGELVEKLVKKQDDITQNKNYRLAKSCAEDADDDDELDALLDIKKQAAAGIAKVKAEAKAKAEAERKKQEEEARINAILNVGDYKDSGNGYVMFGAYPQSKKAGDVQIGEIFDKERGYYLGSDNNLYKKYKSGYYKVEPIKWKVLSRGSEQFIVSELILDQHRFDGSSNNYANSEIRSWLNGEFYNKAFRDGQKSKIVTTNVDNSLASTGDSTNQYVCGNTSDKVFLLSRKETEQYFNSSSARQKKGTDYAKARNLYVASNGNSWWWLRSPFYDSSYNAQYVNYDGFFDYDLVDYSNYGVVCALKFKP